MNMFSYIISLSFLDMQVPAINWTSKIVQNKKEEKVNYRSLKEVSSWQEKKRKENFACFARLRKCEKH